MPYWGQDPYGIGPFLGLYRATVGREDRPGAVLWRVHGMLDGGVFALTDRVPTVDLANFSIYADISDAILKAAFFTQMAAYSPHRHCDVV